MQALHIKAVFAADTSKLSVVNDSPKPTFLEFLSLASLAAKLRSEK
jgi:hypothetical protein